LTSSSVVTEGPGQDQVLAHLVEPFSVATKGACIQRSDSRLSDLYKSGVFKTPGINLNSITLITTL
jgi:hypothetical protein